MATGFSKSIVSGSEEGFDRYCTHCFEDGISKEAEKYCIDCGIYYCEHCLKSHCRIPVLTGHKIVDKSAPEAGVARKSLPVDCCVKHHGKLMDRFCGDHDAVCCSICVAIEHRACVKVHYLPDIASGAKDSQDLKDTKCGLDSLLTYVEQEKTKRLKRILSLGHDKKRISQEIDALEEKFISKIRKLALKSREALDSFHGKESRSLENDIKIFDETLTNLSTKLEHIDNGNDVQIFVKVKEGKKAINDTKTRMSSLSQLERQTRLTFVPCRDQELMDESVDSLGTINLETEECTKDDDIISKYSATLSGKYRINEVHCAVTSVCVLDDETALLTVHDKDTGFYRNFRLTRMYVNDFKVADQLKIEGDCHSVCKVDCQEVAVALFHKKTIQFVSVAGRMTLTRSFSTDHKCLGLAYNPASAELIVTDKTTQMKVYDIQGNILKTYLIDSTIYPLIRHMRHVAVNADDVLYVTDSRKGFMALNTSSDVQWAFNDPELKEAHGICVLPGNVILVSGYSSNNVVQVDRHGKKIGILLGSREKLDHPHALAYDRKTSRLIVGQDTNEIFVYTLRQIEK